MNKEQEYQLWSTAHVEKSAFGFALFSLVAKQDQPDAL